LRRSAASIEFTFPVNLTSLGSRFNQASGVPTSFSSVDVNTADLGTLGKLAGIPSKREATSIVNKSAFDWDGDEGTEVLGDVAGEEEASSIGEEDEEEEEEGVERVILRIQEVGSRVTSRRG
jgi:hypothetical protein